MIDWSVFGDTALGCFVGSFLGCALFHWQRIRRERKQQRQVYQQIREARAAIHKWEAKQ